MLKITLFLAFSLLVHITIAQPFGEAANNYRTTKLVYKNSSGEKGTTYFMYNYNNDLYKGYWELDNKKRSSVNNYVHDDNGNLITAFREFSDSLTSFELFEYDSLGRKIAESFFRSDSLNGSATYVYLNLELHKVHFNNYKGWLNGELEIIYGKNNKKSSGLITKQSIQIGTVNYEYDSNNNLVKEFWDFNGKWSQIFTYEYEKVNNDKNYFSNPFLTNSSNSKLVKEDYTFNDDMGGPSHYKYNDAGLLIEKTFIRSDSLSTVTNYIYDEERRLISSLRKYSSTKIAKFTYNYDEKDNLLLRNFYMNDTLIGVESYLYNSEGLLQKAYYRNFDKWITGEITFHLDDRNILRTADFKGEHGFDAKLTFTYNSEELLTEMIWEFSFGKYMKYNFYYE